jgi:uncharacterized pyridoxal phosphate-containing UPF0001 family protein
LVNTIKDRIAAAREKIARSAARASREPSEIKLIAVTKTRPVEEMLEAAPWVDALGENRVQEAALKKRGWPGGVEWRMIGRLQSNKVRKALELFDAVDSVDSVALARALDRAARNLSLNSEKFQGSSAPLGLNSEGFQGSSAPLSLNSDGFQGGFVLPVLLEVNMSGEASKTGIDPRQLSESVDGVLECPHLKLEGLMTIGPLTDDEARVRGAFAGLREMASLARLRSGLPLPILSMGMSGDFEWAVLEGSTMVRIGTALFGAR